MCVYPVCSFFQSLRGALEPFNLVLLQPIVALEIMFVWGVRRIPSEDPILRYRYERGQDNDV